jgi:hypothetical protein
MSLNDLAAAAEDAEAGGSLYSLAAGLVEPALARVAPDEATSVLSAMRPRTWLRLDAELRGLRHWYGPGGQWQQLTDAALEGTNPLALLLMACTDDGRLRQRAVLTPLMRSDQRLLPLLVIRSADWVEQVRVDARRVLFEALYAADGDGLIRAAGVSMAMRDWHRGDFAIAAVSQALRTGSDGALEAARASDDIQVRRLAYGVWLGSDHANTDAVVQAALTERDIICQSLCAEAVVRAAVRDRQRDTLDRLLAARFARIRVEALAGLVQIGQLEAGEAFLADRSAMVRATAQWAMRRAGRDAAERYRTMLASGDDSRLRCVVAGLGECGTVDDVESLVGFLRHERAGVRAEAVRAVHRLGGSLNQIEMLTDPAPAVVRAVTAALRNRPDLLPAEQLWELLGAEQPRHIRRAAFNLLIARDTWTRIEADLEVVADPDDRLRAHAWSNLTGWLDSGAVTTYQMPAPSTRERLRRLIDATEPDIGAAKARLLRWHLGVSR